MPEGNIGDRVMASGHRRPGVEGPFARHIMSARQPVRSSITASTITGLPLIEPPFAVPWPFHAARHFRESTNQCVSRGRRGLTERVIEVNARTSNAEDGVSDLGNIPLSDHGESGL